MTVLFSYGMGVDSTAIYLRWREMTDEERGFKLDDLIVITAQTGSEYPETIRLVTEHILPLFREDGIRFVELAKPGPTVAHGRYKELQDTREPVALHPDGVFRLIDENRDAGTIPQYGSRRLCSLKFKGEPIDAWVTDNLPGPFTHVVGYEKEEGPWMGPGPAPKGWTRPGSSRVEKDLRGWEDQKEEGKPLALRRHPSYPLVDWQWDRAKCLDSIAERTGASWAKSACTFCPFAEDRGLGRLSCGQAVETMKLEAVAVALNPRQTLFPEHKGLRGKHKGRPMPGSAIETYKLHFEEAYDLYLDEIADGDWSCYEVKRAWINVGANGKPGVGGQIARNLRVLETGSAARCHRVLRARVGLRGLEVETDEFGFRYVDIAPKPDFGEGVEHRIVVAPAGAKDKVNDQYETYAARAE